MYFSLNQERILLKMSPTPTIRINGPEPFYYIEVKEYNNTDSSYEVVGSSFIDPKNKTFDDYYEFPQNFYGDLEFSIYKIQNKSLVKIYSHRYNDYGKLVVFQLNTEDYEEAEVWTDRIREYEKRRGCIVVLDSNFIELDKTFDNFFRIDGLDFYKVYRIGKFEQEKIVLNRDLKKMKFSWFNKDIWSINHPRNWENLSSQEIIDDILGLN